MFNVLSDKLTLLTVSLSFFQVWWKFFLFLPVFVRLFVVVRQRMNNDRSRWRYKRKLHWYQLKPNDLFHCEFFFSNVDKIFEVRPVSPLFSRSGTQWHCSHVPYLFYQEIGHLVFLGFFWCEFDWFIIFLNKDNDFFRNECLMNVCELIFIVVFLSCHYNNNFKRPFNLALFVS